MSIVTIANEAKAVSEMWKDISGSAIAFEIENKDLGYDISVVTDAQKEGGKKGSWDDIPSGEAEIVGTESSFPHGNAGGVVFNAGGGCYFGIAWGDPRIGSAHYYYCGSGEATAKEDVINKIKANWNFPSKHGPSISGSESSDWICGRIHIKIQPGFDPFKLTFRLVTNEEMENANVNDTVVSETFEAGPFDIMTREHNILTKKIYHALSETNKGEVSK